jgi:hypothetical protein
MNKLFSLVTCLALVFASLPVLAQDEEKKERKRYEHFKERNISKTYSASGNSLDILNSFGDVKVITWDKNEIKVDIHIEASSTDKEHAESTFAAITVKDNQSGNKISFETDHADSKKNDNCKNCNSTMVVDYEIHMPAGNTLKIDNSFGGIVIPDYNGTVSLTSKFGSLTTGKLQKAQVLHVEFGKANVKSVGNIEAEFKFSKINIDNLYGANKIDMEFCSFSKLGLASDLSSLKINESYSTLNLKPASGLTLSFDISTSFGSVEDRTNIGVKRTDSPEKYGPDSERHYEGGSGPVKVTAKSSFGRIIIGEASAEDMKDKSQSKDKSKNKRVI